MASFIRTAMAPAHLRSSAVTGFLSVFNATTILPRRSRISLRPEVKARIDKLTKANVRGNVNMGGNSSIEQILRERSQQERNKNAGNVNFEQFNRNNGFGDENLNNIFNSAFGNGSNNTFGNGFNNES